MHFLTNGKQGFHGRGTMIFPLITIGILEFSFIYFSSADVNYPVSSKMSLIEKLDHIINRVSVKLLNSWSRKGHCDNFIRDVCKIKIIPILLKPVLRPWNYLSKEIHYYEIWIIIIRFRSYNMFWIPHQV